MNFRSISPEVISNLLINFSKAMETFLGNLWQTLWLTIRLICEIITALSHYVIACPGRRRGFALMDLDVFLNIIICYFTRGH